MRMRICGRLLQISKLYHPLILESRATIPQTTNSVGIDDCVQVQFQTPCKRATTFVEQIKTAEKIRYLMYVLDDELQLLSPPSFMNTKHAADQLSKIPGKTAENMHD